MKQRVAVTGISGDTGLGAIRGLRATGEGDEGIWILGLDACEDCAARHLVDAYRQLPPVASPAYVDALVAELKLHDIEVLLPCIDSEIAVLSRSREQLATCSTTVVIAPAELVEAADDKLATSAFLAERGVSVAPTWNVEDPPEFEFPMIAKPRRGNGSQGLVVLRTQAHYDAFLSEVRENYCLQREIEGPEITMGLLYDREGVLRDALAMERTLSAGRTASGSVYASPEVSSLIERFGNSVTATGAVNVQLRLDPRQGPVVFEVNARLSGSTALRVAVGYNDPLRLARHFGLGEPIPRAAVRRATVYRYSAELVVWQ